MSEVFVGARRVRLDPARTLGKGGEAEIYAADPDLALKIFKQPDHVDFVGQPAQQAAAAQRIAEHQQKLRAFPRGLPSEVVVPVELCTDRRGVVLGYAMRRVEHADPLCSWADPAQRRAGRSAREVVAIFRALHGAVTRLHAAQIVIGDFNDLNVLVSGSQPWIIDADSFQYGAWPARLFTERFVDPTLCDGALQLARPYVADADWYAFSALLFQSLLCVGPWGGVHQPRRGPRLTPAARTFARRWVLHGEVKYPSPAFPPRSLPDLLLAHFEQVFVHDRRGAFPAKLLDTLAFGVCASCGLEHAHATCPVCRVAAPTPLLVVRGRVQARRVLATDGVIVHASLGANGVRVVQHADGAYRDESGRVLWSGPLDPRRRFAHAGQRTLTALDRELVELDAAGTIVDLDGHHAAFATNDDHVYWCAGGHLWRDAAPVFGEPRTLAIGDVLLDRTRIFVGARFGLGLYRAGARTVVFVFDAERRGVLDGLQLPALPGQLVETRCVFANERAYLLIAHAHAGVLEHRCLVFARSGELLATAEARAHDGSWLSPLSGKVAIGSFLFCATDDGLCRVEVQSGTLVQTRDFPDTAPFVDESATLLADATGLYVVHPRHVTTLSIS